MFSWEQRKLGEFVKIISGDAPSTFISGRCIYVKVDDLNYSDRIQLSSSNLVNINPKAHLVNKGATIFPKRGAAIMTNKVRIMGKDGYLDTNMMALIPEEIDKDFLFTFIQKTGLYKIADTSTIPQINNKHIEPYMIQVPNDKEQECIGVVFEKIDKIITLHQCKLEKLKLTKKALLQKLFPKNGKHIPEIRFKGFTDAWEQRKLGEIGKWYKGIGGTKDDLNTKQSGRMFVHYADLYQTSEFLSNVVHWTINEIIGALIAPNSILFPMSDVTPYGLARTTSCKLKDVRAGGDVLINTIDTNIDSDFVSIYINLFSKNILPFVTGTTVKHINSKSLSELTILIPSFEEQVKIVNLVKFYNEIITLHQ